MVLERYCIECNAGIEECMGYVIARDFLRLLENSASSVREICGKCGEKYYLNADKENIEALVSSLNNKKLPGQSGHPSN